MTGRTRRVEGTEIVQRRAVPAVLAAALLLTAGCSSDSSGGADPSGADGGASAPARTGAPSSPAGSPTEQAPPAKGSVKVSGRSPRD
ncbi:hypothetical protein STENM223S_02231 [Streptomyces tendae]